MAPVMTFLILIHQLMVGLGHSKMLPRALQVGMVLHQVASDSALRSLSDYLVNFP